MMEFVDIALTAAARKAFTAYQSVSYVLDKTERRTGKKFTAALSLHADNGTIAETVFPASLAGHRPSRPPSIASRPSSIQAEEFSSITFGEERWTICAGFSMLSESFCAQLTIPALEEEDRILRYELIAVVDCFSIACKKILSSYGDELRSPLAADIGGPHDPVHEAMAVLGRAVRFSAGVQSAVLLDGDGFVIAAIGGQEKAERVAGEVALFGRRVDYEMEGILIDQIQSVSLSSNEYGLLIGAAPEPGMYLALAAQGPHAAVHMPIIYNMAIRTLKRSSTRPTTSDDLEIRDTLSFAGPGSAGRLVAVSGSSVFHLPSCRRAAGRRKMTEVRPFSSRASALLAGLQPCTVCNP